MKKYCFLISVLLFLTTCTRVEKYDVILRNGAIYDGSGSKSYSGDIAIQADSIAALGDLSAFKGIVEIDLKGLAVAPGFINMLSWATESLLIDGRSQSDIRQGVTLEVMGEGSSMGPLTEKMKQEMLDQQGDLKFGIEWTSLGEYLEHLEKKGVSTNVASFLGNATVRENIFGYESREPTDEELEKMREIVREAMEEGAMGLSSALIYAPSMHASNFELAELAKVVSEYDGLYISHLRSESDGFIEALEELIAISREASVRAEVYHLKASEEANWYKLDEAFSLIEAARNEGLPITADMYMYPASSTGLTQVLPAWLLEGGISETIKHFKDPGQRLRILEEIVFPCSPDKILLVGFKNPDLKNHTGKSLLEIAEERNQTAKEAVIDLIVEDGSRISSVFFTMSEENVKKKIARDWMSFCSDAGSLAPEGDFLKSNPHPRAYGSFARLLGHYVRNEKVIPLEEAVHRLTSFPAENLNIKRRGLLKQGYYADIVVFDPDNIIDHATFENPHQYATGIQHVWVNGTQVLKDGEHTGATPGRVVRGPGWIGFE